MLAVHVIKTEFAFIPLRITVLPGAADDRFEPLRIRAANGIVHGDNAAAAFEKFIEIGAVFGLDGAAFGRIHDQDVGVIEFLGGGKTNLAIPDGATFRQQLFPVGQPMRAVVLIGSMGFWTGAKENAQGLVGLREGGAERKEKSK